MLAHLLIGDVQELGKLPSVGGSLIQHDHKFRVGKHGAGLNGIQQVLHILRDRRGVGVALSELPPCGVEKLRRELVLKYHMELVNKDMGAFALLPV